MTPQTIGSLMRARAPPAALARPRAADAAGPVAAGLPDHHAEVAPHRGGGEGEVLPVVVAVVVGSSSTSVVCRVSLCVMAVVDVVVGVAIVRVRAVGECVRRAPLSPPLYLSGWGFLSTRYI